MNLDINNVITLGNDEQYLIVEKVIYENNK